jgi:hypothetical protein
MEDTIEDYVRNKKLVELEVNYQAKKEFYTTAGGKTYRITEENLIDLIGLSHLAQGADIGVEENNVLSLQAHTAQQITDLLDEIRVYLVAVKTNRFNKREALKAENNHAILQDFDVTL